MLIASEAVKKFEEAIFEKINSEIDKACKSHKREVVVTFMGDEAIGFIEKEVTLVLKSSGYEITEYTNKSGSILTSTTSTGEPSVQLTIKW